MGQARKKYPVLITGILLMLFFLAPLAYQAKAADTTIDASIDPAVASHNGGSPTVVFISDQIGYAFYRDSIGSCVYSKTTNGGGAWGMAVTVDAQTDCFKIAVWYDRWTPGNTTGTFIHISTIDNSDLWYARLDTASDTLTATVNASGANQGGGFAVGANIPSITKGTDGDLYMGVQDSADSFVIKCVSGADCAQAINWVEAGTNPFDLAPDWLILMPLSGGNILAIRWDISADGVQSKVYNDATNTWDALWTTIDLDARENTTYDGHFGATLKKSTGNIYLAYVADAGSFGTDDDIRTAVYSSGAWASKTDTLTNSTMGLTGVKLGFDENTNDIYAVYTARTTPGTASTGNIYWKKSTDGMTSWGAEQGPINTTAGDIYGARVNAMSDERIYVTWGLTSVNDLLGSTVADLVPPDTTAPSAISNLALSNPSDDAITVSWTAPGDDGSTGTATSYDLRYSTSVITAGNFASATAVAGEPTPLIAGTLESHTVTGLSLNTTYFFAIKTSDEVPNTSAISNVPSMATAATPPPPPPPTPPPAPPASLPATNNSGSAPSNANFLGQSYPGSTIKVLRRSEVVGAYESIPLTSTSIAPDGTFQITIQNFLQASYFFAVEAIDKDGRESRILPLISQFIPSGSNLILKDIIIPPTIEVAPATIPQGQPLKILGYAAPSSVVEAWIDGILQDKATSDASGFYTFTTSTIPFSLADHAVKVRYILPGGEVSGFSHERVFRVSLLVFPKTDLNNDGAVNISDWSIFLFRWGSTDTTIRKSTDFNDDGKVDISDFSIFLKSMKAK
ncbi:MAG: hypothetical protein Q8P49_00730 [Candidatus Liptonbacteria bacterium]|nr:hypothetical protein [Candidatus Liptonbacteria bacterium]